MITANVYSLVEQRITYESRRAIYDGLGMVAAYMGETILTSEMFVEAPLNDRRKVNPANVHASMLDPSTDIHLLAVPLERGEDEQMGLAYMHSGLCFVDTTRDSPCVMRTTSAHEAAHALGFVTSGLRHEDLTSSNHCRNGDCLMHKKAILIEEEAELKNVQHELDRVLRVLRPTDILRPMVNKIGGQYDFCTPCKIDMRDNGARNLAKLRSFRRRAGRIQYRKVPSEV